MRYVGYDFNLTEDGIGLDEELDLGKLGWKEGDWFIVKKIDGKNNLIKIDPLVKFIKDGAQC
jgi:hypothetical protein